MGSGQRAKYPYQRLIAGDCTLPLTGRLLIEVNGQVFDSQSNRMPWDGLAEGMIPVQEQNTGMRYRVARLIYVCRPRVYTFRGALSYVTGAHAVKIGGSNRSGNLGSAGIRLLSGELSSPKCHTQPDHGTRAGVMAGERGIRSRASTRRTDGHGKPDGRLRAPVRLFQLQLPRAAHRSNGACPTRNITFPAQPGIGAMNDLSPKFGAAYDFRGDGKTALKVSLNRYVIAMGPDVSFIQLANPARNLVTSATRTWTDANPAITSPSATC